MRARFAAAAVIFAASVVFGQVKESVTVSVVEVPVTVVDRGGNPIKGLTRENFEIIDEGKTGYIVNSEDEAVRAIAKLPDIDRAGVRRVFEARFSSAVMARNYLRLYWRICRGFDGAQRRMGASR